MVKEKNFLKKLAEIAARQRAMGDVLVTPNGTEINKLEAGWEKEVISDDKKVTKADSLLKLEDALNDENIATVIIPEVSAITKESLFEVVDRCPLDKTIFVAGIK